MKTCFKCGKSKSILEFYTHARMADGHLGKCKECTIGDTTKRVRKLSKSPEWVAKERERCRIKSALNRKKETPAEAKRRTRRWRKKNPEKHKAHYVVANAMRHGRIKKPKKCQRCGVPTAKLDKHHQDYSKPLEVIFVCKPCHGIIHRKPLPT